MSNRTPQEARVYRAAHPEQFKEYWRRYADRHADRIKRMRQAWKEANPERFKEIKRNWNERHKNVEGRAIKIRCRNQVNNAINNHRLVRPVHCSNCSTEGRIDAHHEDYSKPFEIIWLCRKCHYALHRARGDRK